MTRIIRIATCNFELNGNGDPDLWLAMHDKLATLGLSILLRQEMWGTTPEMFDRSQEILGLAARMDRDVTTAVYADPEIFDIQLQYPDGKFPQFHLNPTVVRLAVRGLPDSAKKLDVGSIHLNYFSPRLRALEAEALTYWADRRDGCAILGGDTNSYPHYPADGELPLPVLENIRNRPHRAHRSYLAGNGERVMDTYPDEVLQLAGLLDPAPYAAANGGTALAATMDGHPEYGPDCRIDRFYVSEALLPGVEDVEMVDMTGLSDHHTVVLTVDLDTVSAVLADQPSS